MTSTINDYFNELRPEMESWRHELHRHPELAYKELLTADFLAEHLQAFGYQPTRGLGGTGLVATLDRGEGPCIALRTDMDALPIHEEAEVPYASETDGVMHACGHDGHMTMLLAAARYLQEHDGPAGKIHFVFQPAEEGEAGARAMINDGLFRDFDIDEVYGLHNWPGLDTGVFAARVGPQMAAFDVFEITLHGQGAHAAMPHMGQDVLSATASLQMQLQNIVSRSLDPLDAAVVSVTEMHGGDTWNVLPSKAVLRGCTRHLSAATQDMIERRMQEICTGIASSFSLDVKLHYDRRYPATINTAQQTATALLAARDTTGTQALGDELPSMASEDFSFMLGERPGCFIWLGTGLPDPGCILHSPTYRFNDDVLATGAAYWANLAQRRLAAASA